MNTIARHAAKAAPFTTQTRNMSLFYHFENQPGQQFGSTLLSMKGKSPFRPTPDRLIHYHGPHGRSIKGAFYPPNMWIIPFAVFFFPAHTYINCKYFGKTAADYGFGGEH